MKKLVTFLFLLAAMTSRSQSLPSWFFGAFSSKSLNKIYRLTQSLRPAFIQSDFNGDGALDIAVVIVEKLSKKRGVLIIHGKTNEYFILGAGRKFGNWGDDFKWMDHWKVYTDPSASQTIFDTAGDIMGGKEIPLSHTALQIQAYEDGAPWSGGIIYWNGKKYGWIHQGE